MDITILVAVIAVCFAVAIVSLCLTFAKYLTSKSHVSSVKRDLEAQSEEINNTVAAYHNDSANREEVVDKHIKDLQNQISSLKLRM